MYITLLECYRNNLLDIVDESSKHLNDDDRVRWVKLTISTSKTEKDRWIIINPRSYQHLSLFVIILLCTKATARWLDIHLIFVQLGTTSLNLAVWIKNAKLRSREGKKERERELFYPLPTLYEQLLKSLDQFSYEHTDERDSC